MKKIINFIKRVFWSIFRKKSQDLRFKGILVGDEEKQKFSSLASVSPDEALETLSSLENSSFQAVVPKDIIGIHVVVKNILMTFKYYVLNEDPSKCYYAGAGFTSHSDLCKASAEVTKSSVTLDKDVPGLYVFSNEGFIVFNINGCLYKYSFTFGFTSSCIVGSKITAKMTFEK